MINKNELLVALLCGLLAAEFSAGAQAGLFRYDVQYTEVLSSEGPARPFVDEVAVPSFSGYMVFSDVTQRPANIWPDIVDWSFSLDGFVFDTTNTAAVTDGYFFVDADGGYLDDSNFVFDFDLGRTLRPSFRSLSPAQEDAVYLAFSAGSSCCNSALVSVQAPGLQGRDGSGWLTYASPIQYSSTVSVSGTASLLLLGFAVVFSRRR